MDIFLSSEIYANDWCQNEEWLNAKFRGFDNYSRVNVYTRFSGLPCLSSL